MDKMQSAIADINENGLEMPYFKNIKEKYGITIPQNIFKVLKNTTFSEDIDDSNLELKEEIGLYIISKGNTEEIQYAEEREGGKYYDQGKVKTDSIKRNEDGENNIKSFLELNPSLKPPYFKKLKEIMEINDLKTMGREIGDMFSEANTFGEPVTVTFEMGNSDRPFYVTNFDDKLVYEEDNDGNYNYHNHLSYLSESTEVKKIKDLMKRINIIK
ncbi:hypothetical protein N9994_00925 [bacterium]|nr:hypothetical protein [bacterium]